MMTRLLTVGAAALMSFSLACAAQDAKPAAATATAVTAPAAAAPVADPALKTQMDKVSYIIGLNMGRSMKADNIQINTDLLARGIKDAIANKAALTDEQIQETMMAFQREMMEKQATAAKEAGDKNVKEGEAFLAENAKKPGVKTTASGLQYIVVKEGNGPSPKAEDVVKVQYRGTLINGTEFDSSYARNNQPVTFPVNRVIPGWSEGVQLMKVGGTSKFFIPSKLAYGENGAGGQIGPNATLIFDVELLSIEPKEKPAETKTIEVKPADTKKPGK